MKRDTILLVVVAILVASTASAVIGMVRGLGRISVLMEQADSAEVVTERALEGEAEALVGEAEAKLALATSFEAAAQERVDATLREAEARAALIIQEAEGEAAFRRLHNYLDGNPIAQRLAEEMDAEFRVQGMLTDAALGVAAADLLVAHARIGTLEVLTARQDSIRDVTLVTHATTVSSFQAELSLKNQIIEEQQNIIAPSFFRRIFDMPEVALVGAVVGGAFTYYVATR